MKYPNLIRSTAVCSLLSLTVAGCSAASGTSTGDGGADETFVAFPTDFSCFHTWSSTAGVGPPGAPQPPGSADGGLHAGPLTTYINRKPAHGSTSFPVGTIIVKEPTDAPLTERQIFAMVKRGGGYNVGGATDWEWFELRNVDQCNVTILWRGAQPGSGEPYASMPTLCNDCHSLTKSNDFVWTAGLELSSF